jgi:hypothetical protein
VFGTDSGKLRATASTALLSLLTPRFETGGPRRHPTVPRRTARQCHADRRPPRDRRPGYLRTSEQERTIHRMTVRDITRIGVLAGIDYRPDQHR